MLTEKQWKEKEEKLTELINQKKELSKQIHQLKVQLNQHKNYMPKEVNTNTEAYKMFGKPLKNFTDEERKAYYNERQRINRENRKNGIYKRKQSKPGKQKEESENEKCM